VVSGVRSVTIEFASTPPSFNSLGYRQAHWSRMRRVKHAWVNDIAALLWAAKLPKPLAFARATAELRFPQRRRRDEGNFRVLLEKATGDALQLGGWLPDDDAAHYSFGRVTFDAERGRARTLLTVEFEETNANATSARDVLDSAARDVDR
jgi:hypothetical protein